jgi:hypothetical protein
MEHGSYSAVKVVNIRNAINRSALLRVVLILVATAAPASAQNSKYNDVVTTESGGGVSPAQRSSEDRPSHDGGIGPGKATGSQPLLKLVPRHMFNLYESVLEHERLVIGGRDVDTVRSIRASIGKFCDESVVVQCRRQVCA